MKSLLQFILILFLAKIILLFMSCNDIEKNAVRIISESTFHDRMKGAWAGQVIGVTYGYPVEFKFNVLMKFI